MTRSNPLNALPLVEARRKDQGIKEFPGGFALYKIARELWSDEYRTYQTLRDLGFHDAAECAWQRCTAATDLAIILSYTM